MDITDYRNSLYSSLFFRLDFNITIYIRNYNFNLEWNISTCKVDLQGCLVDQFSHYMELC